MRKPKAFPRQRSCRFRGIARPESSPVESYQRDGAGRPVVGGFPGKCLHYSGKDGRGRSLGRKRANRRYRRGTDLFRPGLTAGPPSPEPAASLPGEGFGLTHLRDKSELYAPEQLRCRNEKGSFASLRMTGLRCVVILSETKEPDVVRIVTGSPGAATIF